MLSTQVKDMIARVLFDKLQVGLLPFPPLADFLQADRDSLHFQVPSVNFASAPLLSLMTAGSVTGLVVDIGHLETTVLPVRTFPFSERAPILTVVCYRSFTLDHSSPS